MAGAVVEKDVNRILGYASAAGFETSYRHVAANSHRFLLKA
jgi:hypothetical protein